MENRGKLLVSTKSGAKQKMGYTIYYVVWLLVLILIFAIFDDLSWRLSRELDSDFLGFAIPFAVAGLIVYNMLKLYFSNKSYCEVYETVVSGVTAFNFSKPQGPVTISYNDITNISESGRILIIYTNYATYEFLAMDSKNRAEAIKEIRLRMGDKAAEQTVR